MQINFSSPAIFEKTPQSHQTGQFRYKNSLNKDTISFTSKKQAKHDVNCYAGCILGGAIGDAFGVPIEFKKIGRIKKIYGNQGLTDLIRDRQTKKAKFSDDTQMTIFTAEGLIKSEEKKKAPDEKIIYQSYKNWYNICTNKTKSGRGWISNIKGLYGKNRSGATIMAILKNDEAGSLENPLNSSRGCGGVMRSAPAGLMYFYDTKKAFDTGIKCAAVTHGHPDAYLSAGTYSAIIANLVQGEKIEKAIDNSVDILKKHKGHEKVLEQIKFAKKLAKTNLEPQKAVSKIGQGWMGDGALAMAIYCVLKTPDDFKQIIINASNHSGDSDTVASIAGGMAGAYLGRNEIPIEYRNDIEMKNELEKLSKILLAESNLSKKRNRGSKNA